MKPDDMKHIAPNLSGKSRFERFDKARRQVLTVSKEEMSTCLAEHRKAREKKRRPKK